MVRNESNWEFSITNSIDHLLKQLASVLEVLNVAKATQDKISVNLEPQYWDAKTYPLGGPRLGAPSRKVQSSGEGRF